jgi:BirA family transcriptional regulator, biotin operon repressor / biotin---[acetyl-CoA-carboxylase] ligase
VSAYNHALLAALAPGEPVSGEALGRALGTSRAAIWKAVHRLAALGVGIEALPGRGYRLAAPLSLLDPSAIRRALPAATAGRLAALEVLPETDSTNQRVLVADRPVGALVACLAEYQSAGRGRRGRAWVAPPGAGICLSVGGRLAASPSEFAGLPVAVGVACARALEALGIAGVILKWPNDLLLGGAKLGGILIELRGEADGPVTLAVGVGLNVRLDPAARAAIEAVGGLPAADLAEAGGVPLERNRVAAALLEAVARCLARPDARLAEDVLAGWRERDALYGRAVRIEGAGAARHGVARGLDDSGALLLELADGTCQRVTAGEAQLRRLG